MSSDTLKTEAPTSFRRALEDTVASHGWLGLNTSDAINLVWVDADHQRWRQLLARAVALGLPQPAWVSISARGAHLAWILRTPVVTRFEDIDADVRRSRLLSVTHDLLRRALDGDHAASLRGLMKNPWSSRWQTEVAAEITAVDLLDLLRPLEALAAAEGWIPPGRRPRRARDVSDAVQGERLWKTLCARAYDNAETDEAVLRAWADELAESMGSPAPASMRRGMARRVAKFMRTRWNGKSRRAPLTPEVIHTRQADAGRATAAKRATSRDDLIREALDHLAAAGHPATCAAVALHAGCSTRTVQRSAVWIERAAQIEGVTYAPPVSGSSFASVISTPSLLPSASPVEADDLILAAVIVSEFDIPLPASVIPAPVDAPNPPGNVFQFPWLPPPPPRLPTHGPAISNRARHRRGPSAAKRRAEERREWHERAAARGLDAYRQAFGARMSALHTQRSAALAAVSVPDDGPWLMRWSHDLDGDLNRTMTAMEQRKRIGGGWAAKLRAERRLYVEHEARLLTQIPAVVRQVA
ncbi:replication initiation protein [Muricoccus nepalensis]|uniref:replication initiation protein n=1 Tax=Muricoccus nepalensis TaxID=1854500 RepID=UPI001386A03F|nr:replication initiation protein [Roseomonas nepalensis]